MMPDGYAVLYIAKSYNPLKGIDMYVFISGVLVPIADAIAFDHK
jgi:hypothetical protein